MIALRTIDPGADAPAVFAVFRGVDDDLRRQAPAFETLEDAREYLVSLADVAWAISASGALVGIVCASSRSAQHRSAWMSYWLAPEVRGTGLAARALGTVSEALFLDGFFRLELGARMNNPASIKTAERAGYIQEGVNREELEYDGIRYDTVRMARLASDPIPLVEPLEITS